MSKALDQFKNELSYLEGDLHKEIALRAMQFIPEYFWTVPASTSGRYHPKTSLGEGGLVRHTQSAFRVAQELFGHPLYAAMFTAEERDEIRIALILHDTCKQGLDDDGDGYITEHPILVREALCPWADGEDKPEGMEEAWERICDLIDTHMGIWNTDKSGTAFVGIPESIGQLFVHACDYLSSRRGIEMEGLGEYKPDWRQDPASVAQADYVESLISKCVAQGIVFNYPTVRNDAGDILLKKGMASTIIGELKSKLGMK